MLAQRFLFKRVLVILCLFASFLSVGWLGWVQYRAGVEREAAIQRSVTSEAFSNPVDRELAIKIRRLEYKMEGGRSLSRAEMTDLAKALDSPINRIQSWAITALANVHDPEQGQWAVQQLVSYLNRAQLSASAGEVEQSRWAKAAQALAKQIKNGRSLDLTQPEHRAVLELLDRFARCDLYDLQQRIRVQMSLHQIRTVLAQRSM